MRASAVVEQVGELGQVGALGQQLRDGDVQFRPAAREGAAASERALRDRGAARLRYRGCGRHVHEGHDQYPLSYFGLPNAPVRFTMSSRAGGELGTQLKQRLDDRPLVFAQGTAGRDGAIETTLAMPELAKRDGTGSLKIAASSGCFTMRA